jgi:hypothetical protein
VKLLALPLLLVLVAALAGCGGGGRPVTQTRHVAPFHTIAIADGGDVEVVPGDGRTVVVTAGEKVIDRVRTYTRDGTLHVDIDDPGIVIGSDPFADLRIQVAADMLNGIRVMGAGDLDLGRIEADEFSLAVSGTGDIEGTGHVDRLTATMEGTGDAHLYGLQARKARVSMIGIGDAELNVTDELDLTVEGAGDVTYLGRPSVRQVVEGAGDVHPAG